MSAAEQGKHIDPTEKYLQSASDLVGNNFSGGIIEGECADIPRSDAVESTHVPKSGESVEPAKSIVPNKRFNPFDLSSAEGSLVQLLNLKNAEDINNVPAPMCFAGLAKIIDDKATEDGRWTHETVNAVRRLFGMMATFRGSMHHKSYVKAIESLPDHDEFSQKILGVNQEDPALRRVKYSMKMVEMVYALGKGFHLAFQEIRDEDELIRAMRICDRINNDPRGELPAFLAFLNGDLADEVAKFTESSKFEVDSQSLADATRDLSPQNLLATHSPFAVESYFLFDKFYTWARKVREEQIASLSRILVSEGENRCSLAEAQKDARQVLVRAKANTIRTKGNADANLVLALGEAQAIGTNRQARGILHVERVRETQERFTHVGDTMSVVLHGTTSGIMQGVNGGLQGINDKLPVLSVKMRDLSGNIITGIAQISGNILHVSLEGVGIIGQGTLNGLAKLTGEIGRGFADFPILVTQAFNGDDDKNIR